MQFGEHWVRMYDVNLLYGVVIVFSVQFKGGFIEKTFWEAGCLM